MTTARWVAPLLLFAGLAAASAAYGPQGRDGLEEVESKRVDAAYLLPGSDFRPYTKLVLDRAPVAFAKDWMKSMNETRRSPSRRVADEDARKILEAAQQDFDNVFAVPIR